ncbi:MAG: type II secretion system F family protein [Planctomycetes bacterium]|nr:type II secretion system F family protein [Planctomycetota bacterium]
MIPILFAAGIPLLQLIGSAMAGAGVFSLGWWVLRVLWTEDLEQGRQWRYDISRINELRRVDTIYRVFYPLIRILARFNRAAFREQLPEVQRQVAAAGMPRVWLAEEYLARMELIALFISPVFFYLMVTEFGAAGLLPAFALTIGTLWILRHHLASQAAARLVAIKRRMPYLLDLLTLLMEAGSTFLDALKQGVGEFRGHPVSIEFGRVLTDMNMGKTRTEAFQLLRERLADDEIGAIVGSIIQGETLGTPLARIFRTQSDVLRIKRSQRAEKIAGEAGVNMLLPAVLIMAATVLIILGPFLLNFLAVGLML